MQGEFNEEELKKLSELSRKTHEISKRQEEERLANMQNRIREMREAVHNNKAMSLDDWGVPSEKSKNKELEQEIESLYDQIEHTRNPILKFKLKLKLKKLEEKLNEENLQDDGIEIGGKKGNPQREQFLSGLQDVSPIPHDFGDRANKPTEQNLSRDEDEVVGDKEEEFYIMN